MQSFHLFWEAKLWCPLIIASKVDLITLHFCLTWWMLLRPMLDSFSFGNASVLLLLCTRLHPFICLSYNFSVLICPLCTVSGQDNGCTAAERDTTSTLTFLTDVVLQLVKMRVFLSTEMLHWFSHSLLIHCYRSSPIVLRDI